MNFNKVVTLSLNPALDVTLSVDGLVPEKINTVLKRETDAAGKTVNIAKAFHSFGVRANLITFAGKENAESYFNRLLAEAPGFEYEAILTDGAIRENLHIILPDESLVTVRQNGFTVSDKEILCLCARLSRYFAPDTLFVISGRFPDGFTKDAFRSLCDFIKENGGLIALDSNSVSYDDISYVKPFIIKPNLDELRDMTRLPLDSSSSLRQALNSLSDIGVENVLLSMGAHGLIYHSRALSLHAQPPRVKVLSAVGAGDCTLSGFILSLLSGRDIPTSVKTATAFGTAAVTLPGTKIPSEKEVVEIFNKISVTEY